MDQQIDMRTKEDVSALSFGVILFHCVRSAQRVALREINVDTVV